ncbi:hypothetical protein SLEP1_g11170 [Rubroshorea leprosula]|uniref:Uncharacterized protein n=1 Tax=Rubroshorea leprosula TaxID=152421 RepID=A0AAV5IG85_9ROSI|nr:hypothetical protein SLEP1_g11170 [Rubroshorea leprosula]
MIGITAKLGRRRETIAKGVKKEMEMIAEGGGSSGWIFE